MCNAEIENCYSFFKEKRFLRAWNEFLKIEGYRIEVVKKKSFILFEKEEYYWYIFYLDKFLFDLF